MEKLLRLEFWKKLWLCFEIVRIEKSFWGWKFLRLEIWLLDIFFNFKQKVCHQKKLFKSKKAFQVKKSSSSWKTEQSWQSVISSRYPLVLSSLASWRNTSETWTSFLCMKLICKHAVNCRQKQITMQHVEVKTRFSMLDAGESESFGFLAGN